ncbi:putative membrane protein [Chlamydia ibidis]|nr:putative membrane protein [Chlamydia ibidis]
MSSLTITDVPTLTKGTDAEYVREKQLRRLAIATVIFSLSVVGLVLGGLFCVSLPSIQLVFWVVSAVITVIALICACTHYYLLQPRQLSSAS